jgi:HSP20 family protein
MLLRFDPFRELDRLTERIFEGRYVAPMAMDAYRKGDHVRMEFDLPGVDPASIELTVEKNVLTVKAERHWDRDDAEVIVHERPEGALTRQLFVGDTLDTERLDASYDRGVLRVLIPVTEETKPRRIEVKPAPTVERVEVKGTSAA